MSIATFERRVSRAIKRGNVFDNDIPPHAKDAVKTLEDVRNWKHMWVEEEVTLAAGANSRTVARLKSCEWIKVKDNDAIYHPVKKVSPVQLWSIEAGTPGGYWMSDLTTIQFDRTPETDLTLRYGYYLYSQYDDNLAWLTLSEACLVSQTIVEMHSVLKNPKLTQIHLPIVAAKLETLESAEIEAEFGGQDQRMVPFADETDEYLAEVQDFT